MIKVSVIVPVYNVEKYLRKCLDSLVSQSLKEIEIIVVNDGSTDHSQQIIDLYAEKHPNIIALSKTNGGLSDARNYGMRYASGEYIGFVDSDDYVEQDMYMLLYKKAVENNYDIVECDLFHDYANYRDAEYGTEYYDRKKMLMAGRSVVWNKIYRKEWLDSTGVRFLKGLIYEDVAFYSMLVPYIGSTAYVNVPLIHYVQRESSLNNISSGKTMQILEILKRIITYYKDKGFYEEYYHEMEFLTTRIILCSSFLRMLKIADRKERNKALKSSWMLLNKWFPEWRKNEYLKSLKTRNGFFMKAMNPVTYKLFSIILPAFIYVKNKLMRMNA